MYLLGQAFFSRELIDNRLKPKSVRTVALCALDDAVLRPIAERYGVEVVVDEVESAVADSGQPLKGPVAAFEAALAALTDEPPRCEPIRPRENGTPSVSALIGRNRAGKEGKGREAKRARGDGLRDRMDILQAQLTAVEAEGAASDVTVAELTAQLREAHRHAEEEAQAAEARREAEAAARRSLGRLARLRAAWRGE
jgi:hypothetical protein